MFFEEKLSIAVKDSQSTLCIGLDPDPRFIPKVVTDHFSDIVESVYHFCHHVIDATSSCCCGFKFNVAFFEALGPRGIECMYKLREEIPSNKIVIADAKRGDIPSTAEFYAKAIFEQFKADAVTLNPLMGFETLSPFLEDPEKAVFVLTLTSNPGAADFFEKPFMGSKTLAEYIAGCLHSLQPHAHTHIGMVVGATQPSGLAKIISNHPNGTLLIPGIGKQGGSVEKLAKALIHHKGIPVINSSRGILYGGTGGQKWLSGVINQAMMAKKMLHPITSHYV